MSATPLIPNNIGNYRFLTGTNFEKGIVAHAGGGQALAYPITAQMSRIDTVVTAGDSVVLPKILLYGVAQANNAAQGQLLFIYNNTSNSCAVYSNTNDTLNISGAGVSLSLPAGGTMIAYPIDYNQSTNIGVWNAILSTSVPAGYSTDQNGNVTGLVGPNTNPVPFSTSIAASYFNILPTNADNTAGFAALATYLAGRMAGNRPKITFPAGTFYAQSISLSVSSLTGAGIYPTVNFEGAGPTETLFSALTLPGSPTSSVFFSIAASYVQGIKIDGIGLVGNSSNTLQDGLAIYADVLTTNNTGGLSDGIFEHVTISGFTGRQMWTKGGSYNALFPIQFSKFDSIGFSRPTSVGYPCLEMLGQTGQISFMGGSYLNGTNISTNGGPNLVVSQDHRWQVLQPTTEYPTTTSTTPSFGACYWTSNSYNYPSETPLRVVPVQGQSLLFPSTSAVPQLAIGTTYWLTRMNLWGDSLSVSLNDTDFTLATSPALAGTEVYSSTGAVTISGTTLTLAGANASLVAGQNITINNAGTFNVFRNSTGGISQYAPFTTSIATYAGGTSVTLAGSAPTSFTSQAYSYSARNVVTYATAGTPTSYQFIPLWSAPPVTDGTALTILTYSENHRLITGDPIRSIGLTTNITNASLTTNTTYYVRRINHTQFQLYDTLAHAIAVSGNTGVVVLTGNATDWNNFGFVLNDGTQNGIAGTNPTGLVAQVPYTIISDNLTSQNSETGVYFNSVTDCRITPHFEQTRRNLEAFNASNVNIIGGHFTGSLDAGRGSAVISSGTNTNVTVMGNPELAAYDRVIWSINGGTFNIDDNSPFWVLNDAVSYGIRAIGATKQVSVSTNAITTNRAKTVFINPSANYIAALISHQYSGALVTTRCHTGSPYYVDFYGNGTQGNLSFSVNNQNLFLGGAFRMRMHLNAVATWKASDTDINGWELVGTTGNVKYWQYVPTATATTSGTFTVSGTNLLTVTGTVTGQICPGMTISGGGTAGVIQSIGSAGTTGLGGTGTYAVTAGTNGTATTLTLTNIIPTIGGGDVEVDPLIAGVTVNAPVGSASSLLGQTLNFHFLQNGTGGYTVTMNAVYKGTAPGSGTAGQQIWLSYKSDGTGNWYLVSNSGWLT